MLNIITPNSTPNGEGGAEDVGVLPEDIETVEEENDN